MPRVLRQPSYAPAGAARLYWFFDPRFRLRLHRGLWSSVRFADWVPVVLNAFLGAYRLHVNNSLSMWRR